MRYSCWSPASSSTQRRLALQPLEDLDRVLASRDLHGQRPGQRVGDAREGQELAGGSREGVEHLAHQVVGDRAVVARERRQEGLRRLRVPHRLHREPEAGGPPARPPLQPPGLVGGQGQPGALREDGGLGGREGEAIRPQVPQPALEPQARERQRGVEPARQQEPQTPGPVQDERAQLAHRRRVTDLVDVVEDEGDRRVRDVERVAEPGEEVPVVRSPRRGEIAHLGAGPRIRTSAARIADQSRWASS